jgi:hypothetical protein
VIKHLILRTAPVRERVEDQDQPGIGIIVFRIRGPPIRILTLTPLSTFGLLFYVDPHWFQCGSGTQPIPYLGTQTNSDPDPGQTLPSQKV